MECETESNAFFKSSWLQIQRFRLCCSQNSADVGTRETTGRAPQSVCVWLQGPSFLMQNLVDAVPPAFSPVVQMTRLSRDDAANDDVRSFDELIAASPNLYVLKKRFAYLLALQSFL